MTARRWPSARPGGRRGASRSPRARRARTPRTPTGPARSPAARTGRRVVARSGVPSCGSSHCSWVAVELGGSLTKNEKMFSGDREIPAPEHERTPYCSSGDVLSTTTNMARNTRDQAAGYVKLAKTAPSPISMCPAFFGSCRGAGAPSRSSLRCNRRWRGVRDERESTPCCSVVLALRVFERFSFYGSHKEKTDVHSSQFTLQRHLQRRKTPKTQYDIII